MFQACLILTFLLIILERGGKEITHFFGSILFHRRGDVAVGIEGESCGVVSKETGERFYIHTILQRHRCEGVPQGVEADFFEASPFEDSMEHFQDTVRGYWAAGGGGEYIFAEVIFSFLFLL